MFSLRAVPSPQGRSLGVQRQVTAATSKCPVGALFDKMGGRENVKAAVDKFYQKILADPVTAPFFQNTDMDKQKAHQTQFMMMAFGGPDEYKGKNMYEAHKALALNDGHFNAVAGHFVSTLTEMGVDPQVISEATFVVASMRGQVLGSEKP